jgi:hypothetical protein
MVMQQQQQQQQVPQEAFVSGRYLKAACECKWLPANAEVADVDILGV